MKKRQEISTSVLFSFEGTTSKEKIRKKSGDNSIEDPPVPISNTEVKLNSADGTWRAISRESRTLPDSIFFHSSVGRATVNKTTRKIEHERGK